MIQSFGTKETEQLFSRNPTRRLPSDIQHLALRKLLMIDAATDLHDLRVPPANRLEKLKGDRAGQYSIRINQQWRICFVWRHGHAFDVEVADYH